MLPTKLYCQVDNNKSMAEALEEFVAWGACNTRINNEEQWGLDGRPVDIDIKLDQEPEGPVSNERVAYLNGNDSLNQQPDFDFDYNTPIRFIVGERVWS